MKRLSLALLLAIGALVLVFGSSSGRTPVALAATDACGVEGLDASVLDDAGRRAAVRLAADGLIDAGSLDVGRVVLTLRGRLLADAVVRDLLG